MKIEEWRRRVLAKGPIEPIRMGMSQEDVIAIFGEPEDVSAEKINGKPLIFKYNDIEFHFDERLDHTLFLIYSENKAGDVQLSIK